MIFKKNLNNIFKHEFHKNNLKNITKHVFKHNFEREDIISFKIVFEITVSLF